MQAVHVGFLTFINHATVNGVLTSANYARGLLDYRAQGDGDSGAVFSIQQPSQFYSAASSGKNRGDHKSEMLNADYPDGGYARVGHVFDPSDIL